MSIGPRLGRATMTVFDVALVAGIVVMPVFAWRAIRVVELGLLPLLVLPLMWRRTGAPDRGDWLLWGLFAQYAGLVALNVRVYPRVPGAENMGEGKVALYIGAALALLLLILRFRQAVDVARVWRWLAPLGVLGMVAMLGYVHFTADPPGNCRVDFVSKHLLIPPLWTTVFALGAYYGWARLSPAERWLRHLTLGLVVLSAVAFSGARAVLAAQALTIPALALLLGAGAPLRHRAAIVAILGAVAFSGFAGGLALDWRASCGFTSRLAAIIETVSRVGEAPDLARQHYEERLEARPSVAAPAPAEPGTAALPPASERDAPPAAMSGEDRLIAAVWVRPMLWAEALERIREAPLLGYGYANERALISGGFSHFHQQYLSWLIWGGVPMLVSGLAMLAGPLLAFRVRQSTDGAVLALALLGPLGIGFLAATNLLHTVMVLGLVTVLALFRALARAAER